MKEYTIVDQVYCVYLKKNVVIQTTNKVDSTTIKTCLCKPFCQNKNCTKISK